MNSCTNHTILSPAGQTGREHHGTTWEAADRRKLTVLRAQGVGFGDIARLLGRTETAVRAQAQKSARAAVSTQVAVIAVSPFPQVTPARMGAAELLDQQERTGLSFEQMAARAGILAGSGILYVVADGRTKLSPRYTAAIRMLPDATRAELPVPAPVLAPAVPPTAASGIVNVPVPEHLAAAFQVIVHALGIQL
ncbi:hypothetical protein OG455_39015 [Kitasatospora sp. NBC_01287]|uniref:hypothetical protein n=1 Tax=Kitasatospora sp. NBC_01287 TaxID=2903573 RepID=UPI00224E365D|nr:hypothetical protein [Kitasatospora sp. NBC_01287]MCX4751427.1 hypothetical protein [Kitasatospora sp. NBC_01287]